MNVEAKLEKLGLELPNLEDLYRTNSSGAHYISHYPVQNLLYLSGTTPRRGGQPYLPGVVGKDLTLQQGYEAARLCGLNLLATMRSELGSLDRVRQIVKMLGMVNCAPGFDQTPPVINGCSDLFVEVFGDPGRHARSAVGMAELPSSIPVEIEVIVEVQE